MNVQNDLFTAPEPPPGPPPNLDAIAWGQSLVGKRVRFVHATRVYEVVRASPNTGLVELEGAHGWWFPHLFDVVT